MVAVYALMLLGALTLNLKSTRMVFACFLSCWFLILMPRLIPPSSTLQVEWFLALSALECAFAALLYAFRPAAYMPMIFLCGLCFVTHSLGAAYFTEHDVTPWWHQSALRAFEIGQILCLFIYSPPSIALFDYARAKNRTEGDGDGNYKRFGLDPAVY